MKDTFSSKRSDYTFKYNRGLGRHGWLRLTPAYSVKLVEELISETPKGKRILDPFSGTATTGLSSLEQGYDAVLCDINPFLIWFGNTKLAYFTNEDLLETKRLSLESVSLSSSKLMADNWVPDIHNINRWWDCDTLLSLAALRSAIVEKIGEPSDNPIFNLIWISFSRLIIETSSAAFNHVSMSFNGSTVKHEHNQIIELFLSIVESITSTAFVETSYHAQVLNCDSRFINNIDIEKVDHVVTSPPYPNRMSYIRELRPYMYWTKFLNHATEAADLDWKAIGGTWGSATSKLKTWHPSGIDLPELLIQKCNEIRMKDDKNADLMARYVHKYFYDMHQHFSSLKNLLNEGAKIDYIVGNSSFYGVKVDSEKIFEDSLLSLGFKNVSSRIVRKRNSNKELFEFCVTAYL
ncbi:DNA adenine methylase [Klebsiella quasipneumoniae]|uniref:DNA adenine methylase n=1 Tax=Klebsiella quasipneumoniae TaxID=1463165 RepID=UPI001F4F10CF|nr:DNA adenine methylase [Klebsiella quasipneumoniae]MCH9287323.1 DNA adenine methylase [Klebsiella quasipneumoniae]